MIVWVKELDDELSLNNVAMWVRSGRPEIFTTLNKVKAEDVIIISKYDKVSAADFYPYTVLIYEELYQKIMANVKQEFEYAYDYYYLKNALEQAVCQGVDTVIAGNSYGLFGIDGNMLKKEVNFSLASQDLYYSLKCIYETCEKNSNIKNVVLFLAYYSFHCDLSMTQNINELLRVSMVYEPLFHDVHNCALLPPRKNFLYKSKLFDMQNVLYEYAKGEYEKHYFNDAHPRYRYATKVWLDISKNWNDLSLREKERAGFERALAHNRGLERRLTFEENVKMFLDFIEFCKSKNKHLLIVVPPVTSYYRKAFDPKFKEVFYSVINKSATKLDVLDLFDSAAYEDEDFNDMDHLGDRGAKKITKQILGEMIQ